EVHERMPDERDGYPRFLVELFLEREDHEHARDRLADLVDTPAPPRPDLRRDVVDDGNVAALELAGEAEVEVGVVDEHREIRPLAVPPGEQAAKDPAETAEVPHALDEAHDRELAHVGDELRPVGLRVVAAEPRHGQPGDEGAKVPQQLAAVKIARGL